MNHPLPPRVQATHGAWCRRHEQHVPSMQLNGVLGHLPQGHARLSPHPLVV